MLHDVYLDAIKKHQSKVASISDNSLHNKKILAKAKESWIEYEPSPKESVLAGVDSSYNQQQFQGFHLYAIDAVCVARDGSILAKEFDHDIGVLDHKQLEEKSMVMETNVAVHAAETVDIILLDGSIISRFVSGFSSAVKAAVDLIRECNNVVFVSKSSDTREIFASMDSKLGDIHYFNHISGKPGYSRPYDINRYKKPVTMVFARLSNFTPIIKLEFAQNIGDSEVPRIIDKIACGSVSGYPYVLKLAHNRALVSGNDIERLASIYGLRNEIGSRQVLR